MIDQTTLEKLQYLPNWGSLTDDEKARLADIVTDIDQAVDETEIDRQELIKGDDYSLHPERRPLEANTPLYIEPLINRGKWRDYRSPIWGDSYNWSWNRKSTQIRYLVIHHTVTKHTATPDDIALLHKARGWGGIGYHFVITKDGVVHYVGDIGTARANVANKNELVIGIALIGDFTKHLPSDAQILSAHDLCKFFLYSAPSIPNVNGWEDVVGHKELQATACPGNDWKDTASSLYSRIKGRIPYSPEPVPPNPAPPQPAPPQPPVNSDKDREIRELQEKLRQEQNRHLIEVQTLKRNLTDKIAQVRGEVIAALNKLTV